MGSRSRAPLFPDDPGRTPLQEKEAFWKTATKRRAHPQLHRTNLADFTYPTQTAGILTTSIRLCTTSAGHPYSRLLLLARYFSFTHPYTYPAARSCSNCTVCKTIRSIVEPQQKQQTLHRKRYYVRPDPRPRRSKPSIEFDATAYLPLFVVRRHRQHRQPRTI